MTAAMWQVDGQAGRQSQHQKSRTVVSQQLSRTPKSTCSRVPGRRDLKGNLMHGEEREVSTPSYVLMDAITASAVLMKRQSQQAEIAQFKKEKRGGKRRRCSQALNGGFRYESDLAHGPKRKVTTRKITLRQRLSPRTGQPLFRFVIE